MAQPKAAEPAAPNIFNILKPYMGFIWLLAILTLGANGLTLWVPKLIGHAIDGYARQTLVLRDVAWTLGIVAFGIFALTYLQNIIQTLASEKVAKDLRNKLAAKIAQQSFSYVQTVGSNTLLTNLTSDMDAVKSFVAQAIASLISSIFLIIGGSFLLLQTDWRLGLAVLTILPIIGVVFFLKLKRVRALFLKSREVIDRLNRVINESILGAALIRVLHSQKNEDEKFGAANTAAQDLGLAIVRIFAGLIPIITFLANFATLIILVLGGHYIIAGSLSLGNFAAFNTYIAILIFPILVIGFISNIVAQATASYGRIAAVLATPDEPETGTRSGQLGGQVAVKHLSIRYGEKQALKDVTLTIEPKSRVAIIGPTAAGKTQLLYALTGLIQPTEGEVLYDNHPLSEYNKKSLHEQIGLVFQDSITFNMSLRENIAFSQTVTDESLQKAITTAELSDFINGLPEKFDTIVSERGTSLSGGQKQRLMLARALALNPTILLLDDFTARVDSNTQQKILANLAKNYPDLTLISITQKIAAVEQYDKIILLMEGELLAEGTHAELLKKSPEYVQIYTSQQSTNHYEEATAGSGR